MPEIHDYDGLASSNSAAPPNGFPDGALGRQYPSIIREMMARTRRWHDDICGRLKATGTNGNYVVATSRGLDLARGASIRFRANHENPNVGPTLSVGSSGQRPLTYADGTTIPAGSIKAGQLLDVSIDVDNNRWTLLAMPAAASTGGGGGGSTTVTGDQISLSGQQQGSVPVRAGTSWIAAAAGTTSQFFRGGPNPGFAAVPGAALLACRIGPNPTITNKAGLPHSATASRTGDGRYTLAISPALPAMPFVQVSLCVPGNSATRVLLRSVSTTEIRVVRLSGEDQYFDLGTDQFIDVVAF